MVLYGNLKCTGGGKSVPVWARSVSHMAGSIVGLHASLDDVSTATASLWQAQLVHRGSGRCRLPHAGSPTVPAPRWRGPSGLDRRHRWPSPRGCTHRPLCIPFGPVAGIGLGRALATHLLGLRREIGRPVRPKGPVSAYPAVSADSDAVPVRMGAPVTEPGEVVRSGHPVAFRSRRRQWIALYLSCT